MRFAPLVSPRAGRLMGQRGGLPRRAGSSCALEGRAPGETTVRVSVGRISETFKVTVE